MEEKKFIFILTHSYDRPDIVAGAMQLASNMKAFDIELDFFLMDDGVLIAKRVLQRLCRSFKRRTSSLQSISL